jgi:hypothetical protein
VSELDPQLNARLTAATLETYFAAGTVVPIHVADSPRCTLRIDPPADRLELWTPAVGPEPDVTALSRLSLSLEELDDGPWFVLAVDSRGAHLEAYSLIAAVVDDLTAGRPFHVATARSLAAYRDLLAGRGRLSEEKVLGLAGELLVFEHLVRAAGEHIAVQAWLGPQSEEHDFVLSEFDAEVKTTLSERRSHMVGSEMQFQPSPARPLWLISIQLTRAGTAADGYSLADLVARTRALLTTTADVVSAHLGYVGWRDGDADLYAERYMARTRPAAYLVDDRFPAITRNRLDAVVPRPELVGAVSYRVDVSGLDAGSPTGPLAEFVEGEGA